jgi:sugar O-acyltransferase (sialic acid O-acetyltransferase NeuD family)
MVGRAGGKYSKQCEMLKEKEKKSIVLIGGGGHCKACIDVIETTGFEIAGIIDKKAGAGEVLSYEIIGSDNDLENIVKKDYKFLVTIGQIKDPLPRIKIFERIKQLNGELATVIGSSASVSKYSTIGEGTIVMHQAIVNSATKIGINCILNNRALIEHDCTIGDHTHISTAAVINGDCTIGNRVFIGSNSVVAQGIQIADDVVIGAGSVVIKNIIQPGVFAGNPVRKISE